MHNIEKEEQDNRKLTSKRVEEIFRDCLFLEDEIKDEMPTKEFSVATGVMGKAVFNTEKLNQHKPEILEMIDEVDNIEKGPHFLNMCVAKDGTLWTGEHAVMDHLMVLGLAAEVLKIPLDISRGEWGNFFPCGMPFIIKNQEKLATPVIGENPKNYKAVMKLLK